MFKKVLIATHGSEHASKAVGIGADIASTNAMRKSCWCMCSCDMK